VLSEYLEVVAAPASIAAMYHAGRHFAWRPLSAVADDLLLEINVKGRRDCHMAYDEDHELGQSRSSRTQAQIAARRRNFSSGSRA
jgi:hypothetical protein